MNITVMKVSNITVMKSDSGYEHNSNGSVQLTGYEYNSNGSDSG